MTGKASAPAGAGAGRPSPRLGNVPLPEPYLLGIAASAGLSRVRPWALPGSPLTHRLAGAPLVAAGTIVIARSLQAAGQVSDDIQDVHLGDVLGGRGRGVSSPARRTLIEVHGPGTRC